MEYLLEIKWSDPMADRLADILSALPTDVEQRTASMPPRMNRGFVVLSSRDHAALESVADAVVAAGAAVQVTAGREA
jgi:hypothetical protein